MDARVRVFTAIVVAALLAPALTSCTRAHAKVTPETPPLDVPPPPPRDVESPGTETPPLVPLISEPARHASPQATRPNRPDSARPEAKPEPPKPDIAPAEPPKPEAAPSPPPATTLQTTPTEAEVEVERTIRTVLTRAQNDLDHVDYRRLNKDGRGQYDTAKRLVQQSDDALRAKNLPFARELAGKAATIAAQLAGR